jgi:uncharacterized protein YecE (DUF72 family)
MASKLNEKLGVYVVQVFADNPENFKWILKWSNRLDTDDVAMFILRSPELQSKELILSFKSIFVNTHNVMCLDITGSSRKVMVFRHESFHMYELNMKSILLEKTKDFVCVSKYGIQVIALGYMPKRAIQNF